MARQFVVYGGTLFTSDSQNTASAVVERDSSGNTFQNGVNAATYLSGLVAFLAGRLVNNTVTIDESATFVKCDATSAAFTATLPAAAASANLIYVFVKIDSSAHVVTIKGNGAELINGANTDTSLIAQYNVVRLWCDGTQWWKF